MINASENIARLLKPMWIYEGVVSSAAFNLRPHIHETYISVMRESVDTFSDDARKIAKDNPIWYASMNTADVCNTKVDNVEDIVGFEINEVDNQNLKSHAGIFISINDKRLVGGEPFEAIELQKGKSADQVLLEIRKSLAKLASMQIKSL